MKNVLPAVFIFCFNAYVSAQTDISWYTFSNDDRVIEFRKADRDWMMSSGMDAALMKASTGWMKYWKQIIRQNNNPLKLLS